MLEPSRSASPSPQSPTLEGRQCGSPVSSLPAAVLLRRRVSLRRLLRTEYVSATPRRAVSPLHALVYPRSLLQSVSPSKAFRGGSEAGSPLWLGRLGRPCLGRVTDVTGTDLEPSRWFWSLGSIFMDRGRFNKEILLCNSCLGFSAFDPYTASYRNTTLQNLLPPLFQPCLVGVRTNQAISSSMNRMGC